MNNILEIDLCSIYFNIKNLSELEKKIIFVAKGDLYGYNYSLINYIDKYIDSYAVSSINEAIEIRRYTKKCILVLSPVPFDDIIDDDKITYTISSTYQFNTFLNNAFKKTNIALKINTGLNRFGLIKEDIEKILDSYCSQDKLVITDIFTHLSNTTSDDYIENVGFQYKEFLSSLSILENQLDLSIINTHYTDSAALLQNLDLSKVSSIRTGMFLLGLNPLTTDTTRMHFPLTFKTKALDKHIVEENGYYGYNKKSAYKIFTITIGLGYCDGIRKSWINHKIFNSKWGKLKLIDVSMNSSIIEVREDKYNDIIIFEDYIVLFSSQKELESLANYANTSIEDVVCSFNKTNNNIVYKEKDE